MFIPIAGRLIVQFYGNPHLRGQIYLSDIRWRRSHHHLHTAARPYILKPNLEIAIWGGGSFLRVF